MLTTPVKGTPVVERDSIDLIKEGVYEDRRFFLIDENNGLAGCLKNQQLYKLRSYYDRSTERLRLVFPLGNSVEGDASLVEEEVQSIDFFGERFVPFRVMKEAKWHEALSGYLEKPVRLVRVLDGHMGSDSSPVTILSSESLNTIGEQAGEAKRFRMLIEVAGGDRAFYEEVWQGKVVQIGTAKIEVGELVPRCEVTTRNVESGEKDCNTLRAIVKTRGKTKGNINFGVYGTVIQPGTVKLNDIVTVVE